MMPVERQSRSLKPCYRLLTVFKQETTICILKMLSFPSQLDVEEKIGLGAMAGKIQAAANWFCGSTQPLLSCFRPGLDVVPSFCFCICTFSPFFNCAWRSCQGGRWQRPSRAPWSKRGSCHRERYLRKGCGRRVGLGPEHRRHGTGDLESPPAFKLCLCLHFADWLSLFPAGVWEVASTNSREGVHPAEALFLVRLLREGLHGPVWSDAHSEPISGPSSWGGGWRPEQHTCHGSGEKGSWGQRGSRWFCVASQWGFSRASLHKARPALATASTGRAPSAGVPACSSLDCRR